MIEQGALACAISWATFQPSLTWCSTTRKPGCSHWVIPPLSTSMRGAPAISPESTLHGSQTQSIHRFCTARRRMTTLTGKAGFSTGRSVSQADHGIPFARPCHHP